MFDIEEAAATVIWCLQVSFDRYHHITPFSVCQVLIFTLGQLEIVYTLIAYQEFESLSLRQQKTRMNFVRVFCYFRGIFFAL